MIRALLGHRWPKHGHEARHWWRQAHQLRGDGLTVSKARNRARTDNQERVPGAGK